MEPDRYDEPCPDCGTPKHGLMRCRACGFRPDPAQVLLSLLRFILLFGSPLFAVLFFGTGGFTVSEAALIAGCLAANGWVAVHVYTWLSYARRFNKAFPKPPTPLPRRLINLWLRYGPRRRRAKHPWPRPDFLEAELTLVSGRFFNIRADGREERDPDRTMAWFLPYPPDLAQYHGWVKNLFEYEFVADLVFAYRFPGHPFSKEVRESWPEITDAQIELLAKADDGILADQG